jgi:hypothetical protein
MNWGCGPRPLLRGWFREYGTRSQNLNMVLTITHNVPRGLFFATQQRIAITWKLKQYKKSAVPRGENISKKKGEKSCNFGEIIKKQYFIV